MVRERARKKKEEEEKRMEREREKVCHIFIAPYIYLIMAHGVLFFLLAWYMYSYHFDIITIWWTLFVIGMYSYYFDIITIITGHDEIGNIISAC